MEQRRVRGNANLRIANLLIGSVKAAPESGNLGSAFAPFFPIASLPLFCYTCHIPNR